MPDLKNARAKFVSLLKKTEKYTKTDNLYLAKGGFWLSISQITSIFVFMILGVVWARFVPKQIYGEYKFIISFGSLFTIFSLTGMKLAITRAVAKGYHGTLKAAVKTMFRWNILALLAGCTLAIYYWVNQNQTLAICFLIAGISSPFVNSLSIFTDYLAGRKKFDFKAQLNVLKNFLTALLTVSAIFLTKNVVILVLVYFLSRSFIHTIFYYLSLKKYPPNQEVDKPSILYGKHLSLIDLLGKLAGELDKILVFHYLGAVELAIYSFATLVPSHINGFSKNIQQLALPKFSTRPKKEIKEKIKEKTIRLGLFLTLITIIYIILAPFIFKVLFPTYQEAVPLSQIFALSLLASINILPATIFYAKSKTKLLYIKNISLQISRIIIMFLGVYFFGLWGLIIAIVIQQFLDSLVHFLMVRFV